MTVRRRAASSVGVPAEKPVAGFSGAGPPMLKSEGGNLCLKEKEENSIFRVFCVQPPFEKQGFPFIGGSVYL